MNETLKTIAARNSCRGFKDTPLTDEQIQAITEAALAAPSAMNRQPWHVTLIKTKELVDELDAYGVSNLAADADQSAYERVKSRGGKMYYNAPCMAIIMCEASKFGRLDSGILVQNMALAAHSLGLGSCIVGMAEAPLHGPRGDEYKKRLNIPEGLDFAIGILIGTPDVTKEPHELDFSKFSHVE